LAVDQIPDHIDPLFEVLVFLSDLNQPLKKNAMAGKPKSMSQIKQLILLHRQGKGRKTIARTLGISKNTVRSYLDKLDDLTSGKFSYEELVAMDAPVLEAQFHPGNPAYKDDRFDSLKADLDYYLNELKRVGVNKTLLWKEYKEKHLEGYGYSQFCFHLQQHQTASKPSMVLEHKPGEKLYIDFAGKKLCYIDKETGEAIECHVFVACLPYSDYAFAMAVESQSTTDFLYALSCCLRSLGGVPLALVPDNLKAAVVKADRYEPQINRALEDFANHYGTTVLPARARKPKDKALVENQVRLIYNRVYAKLRNTTFFDLQSLNRAVGEKMKAHNQTRMQQKPWCREERFLAEEKPLLAPLPVESFQLKHYKELTVAKNNHVYLSRDKHHYSVPHTLIGRKVKVVYTRSMVHVYHKGQQVAVHVRNYRQGGYTYDDNHLCSQHRHYKDRSPDHYIGEAQKRSQVLHELVSNMFKQNKHPELLYKTCDGLFRLHKVSEPEPFEKACRMAVEHKNYSYGFVMKILENKMTDGHGPVPDKPLPDHNNIRGKSYFQQF
jgi:transposase